MKRIIQAGLLLQYRFAFASAFSVFSIALLHPSISPSSSSASVARNHHDFFALSVSPQDYMECLSKTASEALKRPLELTRATGTGGASGGGGGATTSKVQDKTTGETFFVKAASGGEYDMLYGEYVGIKAMADTNTIKVPKPICVGLYESGMTSRSFVMFEYLEFTSGGSQFELGVQLAKMHRHTSENGMFGFHVDNTIGATPQPNLPWSDNWAEFWDTHRLCPMLKLTDNEGYSDQDIQTLRTKTKDILSKQRQQQQQHNPQPSLLHGDLWGGNKAFCKDKNNKIVPVIFDPATYYGDREADVAMTEVFGGFSSDFYEGYESEWPLDEGYEERKEIYNLYHILNHDVLFGGMYMNRARGMMDKIIGKYSDEPDIYY